MKFKEPLAQSIYKRLKCWALIERISDTDIEEIEEIGELQFLAQEINYYRSCYEEEGHCFRDDLIESKEILKKTKNGTVIIIDPNTRDVKKGYTKFDILRANETLSEYRQLQYYEKKLKELGYYGKW